MSINQITTINLLEDDNLIQKIRNKFNADDMQIFEFNINIYKTFKNNKNDFIIEFDEVCKYIGFSRIDHAKRLLIKEFIDKNDYIIILPLKGVNVLGRHKEKIMLNIKCFKKFCLVAATKQSKILYDYYITMEEIIMEYMEEQFNNQNTILEENKKLLQLKDKEFNNQNNIIIKNQKKLKDIEIENKQNKQIERQKVLLNQYGTAGPLIYIIRVKTYTDKSYIIKIGESRIGVLARFNEHKTKYDEVLLLDCFIVNQSRDFELFLHNHDKIKYNRVSNLENHENEKELFLIGKDLSYDILLNIISANIKNYDDINIEKLRLECDKLRLLNSITENNNINFINELINSNITLLERIDKLEKSNQEILTIINPSNIKITTNFNEPLITLGPRLQKLNPDTLTIVKVYESVAECMKEDISIRRPSMNKAIKENTVYRGFRWLYVNRDIDPNTISDIEPTKKTHTQNIGYIAKINKDKTEIVNVYLDKKVVCKYMNKTASALDLPVKNYTLTNGFYYVLYNDCDDELKNNYEAKYGKPILYKNGVGQYDIKNNLIKEFVCKSECFRQLQMSDKTLSNALDYNKLYHNHYFKHLESRLRHRLDI